MARKIFTHYIGTIDESYEGELVFAAQYIPELKQKVLSLNGHGTKVLYGFDTNEFKSLQIKYGDAIGQIIPVERKVMTVEDVSNEELEKLYKDRAGIRGAGGFRQHR